MFVDVKGALLVCLAILSVCVHDVRGLCQIREVRENINMPGVIEQSIRFNICVDNTEIRPIFSTTRPDLYHSFSRECCGCRVADVMERSVPIQYYSRNSDSGVLYVPIIQQCECIPCNNSVYSWSNYFSRSPAK